MASNEANTMRKQTEESQKLIENGWKKIETGSKRCENDAKTGRKEPKINRKRLQTMQKWCEKEPRGPKSDRKLLKKGGKRFRTKRKWFENEPEECDYWLKTSWKRAIMCHFFGPSSLDSTRFRLLIHVVCIIFASFRTIFNEFSSSYTCSSHHFCFLRSHLQQVFRLAIHVVRIIFAFSGAMFNEFFD